MITVGASKAFTLTGISNRKPHVVRFLRSVWLMENPQRMSQLELWRREILVLIIWTLAFCVRLYARRDICLAELDDALIGNDGRPICGVPGA